jgi:short-subunit dehydrogenase involved in D-alanine esterification of teichoic acids
MKVDISGRTKESVDRALKDLDNDNVFGVVSDVAVLQDEVKAVKVILETYGILDVVRANAGV